jgi:hypothetical protein
MRCITALSGICGLTMVVLAFTSNNALAGSGPVTEIDVLEKRVSALEDGAKGSQTPSGVAALETRVDELTETFELHMEEDHDGGPDACGEDHSELIADLAALEDYVYQWNAYWIDDSIRQDGELDELRASDGEQNRRLDGIDIRLGDIADTNEELERRAHLTIALGGGLVKTYGPEGSNEDLRYLPPMMGGGGLRVQACGESFGGSRLALCGSGHVDRFGNEGYRLGGGITSYLLVSDSFAIGPSIGGTVGYLGVDDDMAYNYGGFTAGTATLNMRLSIPTASLVTLDLEPYMGAAHGQDTLKGYATPTVSRFIMGANFTVRFGGPEYVEAEPEPVVVMADGEELPVLMEPEELVTWEEELARIEAEEAAEDELEEPADAPPVPELQEPELEEL